MGNISVNLRVKTLKRERKIIFIFIYIKSINVIIILATISVVKSLWASNTKMIIP